MKYGRYEIVREIGRGSMGVVYLARDPSIDRQVALKVLRQDRMESESFVRRFLKEAKVIGRLANAHIVTIYDVGEEEGRVYIAMELLEGHSLSELIKEKVPEVSCVVKLGIQLAETLDYAHLKGVVHRDIKPSNIIVQNGQVKITDFGIAHLEDATMTMQTQAGEMMGTPAYMSPEQVLGQPVDGRSDIFSLGIILYELCTGKRPFGGDGKSLMTVFNEIVDRTPEEPLSAMPTVPAGLSRVIMKALHKDASKRFQTGREFAEALSNCLEQPAAPPPAAPLQPSPGRAEGRNFLMPLCLVLAAIAVSCGAYYFFSEAETHSNAPAKPPHSPQVAALPPAGSRAPDQGEPPQDKPATDAGAAKEAPPRAEAGPKPSATKPESPKKVAGQGKTRTGNRDSLGKGDKGRGGDGAGKTRPANSPLAEESPPVKTAEPTPPPASAKVAEFAFLKVESSPVGARVFINGVAKGTTPLNERLALGRYQVRLSRPGYRDVERQVNLESKQLYPLQENLAPVD